MSRPKSDYIGRFAPSPTGPLHIGSLVAALASYLDAKANGGQWLLRVEDLDPPREQPGAANAIIKSLLAHGLQWDGDVLWQSQCHKEYSETAAKLSQLGYTFHCDCSRKQLQEEENNIYSGHCRNKKPSPESYSALRVKSENRLIQFDDLIQGKQSQNIAQQTGDFIIQRKDGLFAYQLAVVVDDARQGITHIVRGADLLDSTPRQMYLQQLLDLNTPTYAHIALLVEKNGQKLSKQNHAPAIDNTLRCKNLITALSFLQQPLPPPEDARDLKSILHWATTHWRLDQLPKNNQQVHTQGRLK